MAKAIEISRNMRHRHSSLDALGIGWKVESKASSIWDTSVSIPLQNTNYRLFLRKHVALYDFVCGLLMIANSLIHEKHCKFYGANFLESVLTWCS